MQHSRPGDFIPAIREDLLSAKTAVALGVSLLLGLIFWTVFILLVVR